VLVPVAHQPVDMVLALTDVEVAAQVGIALGILIDEGNRDALRQLDGGVRISGWKHPENHGEFIALACQFPQRYADVVTGVKLEIEAELRLDGRDGAREIFAGVVGLQDGAIGGKQTRTAAGDRGLSGRGGRHQKNTHQQVGYVGAAGRNRGLRTCGRIFEHLDRLGQPKLHLPNIMKQFFAQGNAENFTHPFEMVLGLWNDRTVGRPACPE